ncbi:hypothetical protein [uncultured Dysosmobacter sp.]|uniref:hypothetical protein n=1 Tax=uncultured Dysosmobacter sp. TaxID=2591384 RepID=UPI002619DD54|nr:hypothetical protein [uncultured Dysosmobacter sp.]
MTYEELESGYYATIPRPVLDDAELRWPAMVLYAHITSYTKNTGFCYAKNETLIREMTRIDPKTGAVNAITERTLQSLLAELRERGHIHMDTGPIPKKDGGFRTGRRIFIGARLDDIPKGEEIFTPENNFTQGVKKSSPHTNKVKQRSNNPLPPALIWDAIEAYIGDDPEYRAAFEAFLANRAALKKPFKTKQAVSIVINRLRRVNNREVEIAMLNKAVEYGWMTVYPLKPDELPQNTAELFNEEGVDGI